MRTREFIVESTEVTDIAPTTARLDVDVELVGGENKRTFFEGFLRDDADDTPDWIKAALLHKRKLVVEATCENDNGVCLFGHIQAYRDGCGFATELGKYIIDYYRNQGVNNFKAYINHMNSGSKNVFRKLGFAETKQQRDGSFWTLTV